MSLFSWVEKFSTVGCWDIGGNIGFPGPVGTKNVFAQGDNGDFLNAKRQHQ